MHQPSSFFRILLLGSLLVLPALAAATEKTDLNGTWLFRTDPKSEGESQAWFKSVPAGTEPVHVPHTWNIGKYDDYEGLAWYFRTFDLPALAPQKHVELHFAATFYLSHVWVNGTSVGSHEGGHTEYFFDITRFLRPGQNTIALALDNRPTETSIPGLALKLKPGGNIWYDWWHYGGIVRDVWLTENDVALIRRQQIVGNDASMAAPPHGFGTHDGAAVRPSKLAQSRQSRTESFAHGVVGVIVKTFILPEGVERRRHITLPPAQAAERRDVLIPNLVRSKRRPKLIRIVLRVRTGARDGAHVRDDADLRLA